MFLNNSEVYGHGEIISLKVLVHVIILINMKLDYSLKFLCIYVAVREGRGPA